MAGRKGVKIIILRAATIGNLVPAALRDSREGRVLGRSSHGLFVQLGERQVLFLSEDPSRGPLTVNLEGSAASLAALPVGSEVRGNTRRLVLGRSEVTVSLDGALVWGAPPPTLPADSSAKRASRISALATDLASHRESESLTLIRAALGSAEEFASSSQRQRLRCGLALRQSFSRGSLADALEASEAMLGAGSGLTPAGDDVLIGLILMLNRWRLRGSMTESATREFASSVVLRARARTTALSASLISSAASGQAPERLIRLADFIARGTGDQQTCVRDALAWGNSSGVDALAGMSLAATALPPSSSQ